MTDIIDKSDWWKVYDKSSFTIRRISTISGIDEGSVRQYINSFRTPRSINLEKMGRAMFQAAKKPRLKYHPSYGYATEEQIAELKNCGVGPRMEQILKEISKQTFAKGKMD